MRPDQRNIILGNLSEEESNRIAISRNMIDSICYSVMVEPEDFNIKGGNSREQIPENSRPIS